MTRSVVMKQDRIASPKAGVSLRYGMGGVYQINGTNMTPELAKEFADNGWADIVGEDEPVAKAR